MGKMKSLLDRSLSKYILCTIVILLIFTPVFYLLTRHFYAEDMIDLINSVRSGGGIPENDLEQDIMAGVMIQFALIIVALSIASVITMRLVAKHIWAPFKDTLHKAEAFDVEKGDVPVFTESQTEEFQELNMTLGKLMSRSVDKYRVQKEFTENAAHELQTPIAIISGKLDVLLQDQLDEKQLDTVREIYEVVNRMSRLNRNLLLLAKIDNNQYGDFEKVDFHTLASTNIEQMRELYGKENKVFLKGGNCTVFANLTLSEMMLNNLLVNAFRHTGADGTIVVSCGKGCISVSNTAIAGKLDANKIFARFNHSSEADRGNGIGLAIVKAICDFHGWKIEYSFQEGMHHFSILFP
jgi:two-component system OmpR family sensor kinase